MKKKLILLLILLALPGFSFAEERSTKLTVSPHTLELKLERGEVYTGKIKIINQSEFPVPLAVRATDFSAEEESGGMQIEENSLHNWFEIKNQNFILEKGEAENVDFEIAVPDNAELGGYYSVVLFDPQFPSYYFEDDKPRVLPSIGTIFLISVTEKGMLVEKNAFTVTEFNIPEKFHLQKAEDVLKSVFGLIPIVTAEKLNDFSLVSNANLAFSLKVKNNGLYHVKPTGKVEIISLAGKIAGESEIKKTTILPGKNRRFPVEFKPDLPRFTQGFPEFIKSFLIKNLFWGKYTAQLYLESETTLTPKIEKITFWIFPWKTAGVTFLVLLFLVFLRKRLQLVLKVLMKKETVKK